MDYFIGQQSLKQQKQFGVPTLSTTLHYFFCLLCVDFVVAAQKMFRHSLWVRGFVSHSDVGSARRSGYGRVNHMLDLFLKEI